MPLEKRVGRIAGPLVFVVLLLMPTPEGMAPAAQRTLAVAGWMAVWWVTEAIPIPATSLLPIALFPLLHILPSKEATPPYANHLIFLFMGGFLIAVTMERWELHRRVALQTVRVFGSRPDRIILGFMVATAFISMWVSNTATAMMMVPIGLAIVRESGGTQAHPRFGVALMLAIAYAASIGGVGTIIGTPPNTVLAAMMDKLFNRTITFWQWMAVGVPLAVVMLALAWLMLTSWIFPQENKTLAGSRDMIREELKKLGPMTTAEKRIVAVGTLVAICWVARGFIHLDALSTVHDATIAMAGALLLFVIPSGNRDGRFLLDWETALKVPWGIMLLFGGGLALANGFMKSGLAHWVAGRFEAIQGWPLMLVMLVVIVVTVALTEMTSNTATATLIIPIVAGVSVALGVHPYALVVTAGVSASFAFMLPVATPPNAVVFGSGYVTIRQMLRAGIWLNLVGAVVTMLVATWLMPLVWGIDLTHVPDWAHMLGGG